MVDVSSRPQPQLGASLAGGEHDAEIILSWNKKMSFFFSSHLSNAATQLQDPLPLAPEVGEGMRGGREGGSKNESGKEGRRREFKEDRKGKREEFLPVKIIITMYQFYTEARSKYCISSFPCNPSLFHLLPLLENSPLFCDNDSGSTALVGVTIAWDNFNACITVISMQVSHELCVCVCVCVCVRERGDVYV